MTDIPLLESDPKNRRDLEMWLRRREKQRPGEPLNAREYLMVQRLQSTRKAYSEM